MQVGLWRNMEWTEIPRNYSTRKPVEEGGKGAQSKFREDEVGIL